MEVFFYPMLPDLRTATAFPEVPRLRPLVLLIKSNMYTKMNKEHWRNDTDRGKPNYAEKNLSQCNLFHHTNTHITRTDPGSKPGFRCDKPANTASVME
jgi:hypothetical protein